MPRNGVRMFEAVIGAGSDAGPRGGLDGFDELDPVRVVRFHSESELAEQGPCGMI